MFMEKIRHGILQVSTDHGPRFVEPSLPERLRLIWMFRNFKVLPQEVLNQQEQLLVRHLCGQHLGKRAEVNPDAVIGIVEQRPTFPPKKRAVAATRVHEHTA